MLDDPEMELEQGERDDFLQRIHANTELLITLINDILDLSKLECSPPHCISCRVPPEETDETRLPQKSYSRKENLREKGENLTITLKTKLLEK